MRVLKMIIPFSACICVCASVVFAGEVEDLFKEYRDCDVPETCQRYERDIIQTLLPYTDIPEVAESMPKPKDLDYKFIPASLSGSDGDYIVRINFDRFGYIIPIVQILQKDEYEKLAAVEMGYIFSMDTKDITGDRRDEMIVHGYGTGTGYASRSTAIYSFKDMKLHLIWSGETETEQTVNDILEKRSFELRFMKVEGQKSKDISQVGHIIRIDTKRKETISDENIFKKYRWSEDLYKYIEINIHN